MSASADEIARLYDEHAPRLYALALRITGDETRAAEVLESVFVSGPVPAELASLVRLTRDHAIRFRAPSVESSGGVPSARLLVEEAFYRGRSIGELARDFALDEETVRGMLRDGMAELQRTK